MLSNKLEYMYKTFGYRFMKGPVNPPAQLYSLGWQLKTSHDYDFDGMNRPEESGNCIFQYTISGAGMIEYQNQNFVLEKGTAFLTVIPSNHRYYLPKHSDSWEFIFITLTGNHTLEEWRKIQEQFGPVIQLKEQDEIIKYIWEIYRNATNNKIRDGYESSSLAYEFIMKLYRSLYLQQIPTSLNHKISDSIVFMKDNLHKQLSLTDISDSVNMSKYHFNHTFTKTMAISPWNYLTKLRIEYSIELLITTNLTVDEISSMVGYTSSNYFNKVFRKYMATSPGKLREQYADVKDFTYKL